MWLLEEALGELILLKMVVILQVVKSFLSVNFYCSRIYRYDETYF